MFASCRTDNHTGFQDLLADERVKGIILQGPWTSSSSVCLDAKSVSSAVVPVVAAMTGTCSGTGLECALAAPFRHAADTAVLDFSRQPADTSAGIHDPAVDGLFAARRILTAMEAKELGIIHAVLPQSGVEQSAQAFLEALCANRTPVQIRSIMTSILNASRLSLADALHEESRLFVNLAKTAATAA